MKRVFILFIVIACYSSIYAQKVCLSEYEMSLYKHINSVRKSKKLAPIELSKCLTVVAQTHANDLALNYKASDKCNLHTWSNKGKWTPCCYTDDHKSADCMWDKPKELTDYKGSGYEIAFYTSNINLLPETLAEEALKTWLASAGHSIVILNKGIWKSAVWKAIGVGYAKGYAVIWFGEAVDEESNPEDCK